MTSGEERLAVSVITGFLGSGKSTVIRHLLDHPAMDEAAVIVNEFGEVGIDHALVAQSDEDIVLMSSGCLCCTIRGDLVDTLRDLYSLRARREVPAFERVLIETTGLADPAPILHTLMSDPVVLEHFRLDGVVATVDAVNGAHTLDAQPEAVKQAAVADRILLTKTDLVERPAADAIRARIEALNPAAPIHLVEHGAIEPAKLFNAGLYDPATKTTDVRRWLREQAYADAAEPDHDHGHDVNRHNSEITAFCLYFDEPFDWDSLACWLELLATYRGDDLLRVKGLFNVADFDKPVVIHGVQHVFHPPATIDAWPDDDHRSRAVFITRNLEPATIERTLAGVRKTTAAPAAR